MSKELKPKLKVVVRNLPANLTEDQFKQTLEHIGYPISNGNIIDFFYYVPGKISETKKENAKAFINFTNTDNLFAFADKFHGHVFISAKGMEQKAQVEYSPFQKIPKQAKKKVDTRENTIHSDPDYLTFLEELKKPVIPLPSAEDQLDKKLAEERDLAAQSGGVLPPKISPLVEFLNQKKQIKVQKILRRNKRVSGSNPTSNTSKEEPVKGAVPPEKKTRQDDRRKRGEGKDSKRQDEDKRNNKNGTWAPRKQDSNETQTGDKPNNTNEGSSRGGRSGGRSRGRQEMKVYTPKVYAPKQPTAQPSQSGNNA